MTVPRRILFLCVHNAARSQLAEGLTRAFAPPGVTVWSAGTESGRVHPAAIQVMDEIGVDIRAQTSKALRDVPWREADTVVTLCAEGADVCPAVPGDVRRMHWPLPDPTAAPEPDRLRVFRETRDEILRRLKELWPQQS